MEDKTSIDFHLFIGFQFRFPYLSDGNNKKEKKKKEKVWIWSALVKLSCVELGLDK